MDIKTYIGAGILLVLIVSACWSWLKEKRSIDRMTRTKLDWSKIKG